MSDIRVMTSRKIKGNQMGFVHLLKGFSKMFRDEMQTLNYHPAAAHICEHLK